MPQIFSVDVVRSESRLQEAVFKFTMDVPPHQDLLIEALMLRRDLEICNVIFRDILNRIRLLNLYDSYVTQLEEVARTAFASDLPDFITAKFLLEKARSDFVFRIGSKYRMWQIKRMSLYVLAIGIPSLLYGMYLSGPIERMLGLTDRISVIIYCGMWTLFGIAVSVWLSALIRNRKIEWSNIDVFDPDGFSPVLRIGFVCCVTFLFALLLYLQVIKIGVGTLDLGGFFRKPSAAILLGVIGGLAGDSLTKTVMGRIQNLVETSK